MCVGQLTAVQRLHGFSADERERGTCDATRAAGVVLPNRRSPSRDSSAPTARDYACEVCHARRCADVRRIGASMTVILPNVMRRI